MRARLGVHSAPSHFRNFAATHSTITLGGFRTFAALSTKVCSAANLDSRTYANAVVESSKTGSGLRRQLFGNAADLAKPFIKSHSDEWFSNVYTLRGNCAAVKASSSGLQSGRLPADNGDARTDRALVYGIPERTPDQITSLAARTKGLDGITHQYAASTANQRQETAFKVALGQITMPNGD